MFGKTARPEGGESGEIERCHLSGCSLANASPEHLACEKERMGGWESWSSIHSSGATESSELHSGRGKLQVQSD